ncbi:hypothetical protein SteCoe_24976 [Stentor coeruleus]|uniref:Peptidase S26 domain-containing protein n=1 Tax=Stentor coeruleus TaxID=5963 RepID=A0A1R2BG85_9CILI|nr:hypothetical protein SteCoe_24976 [Stentor coeruleus]
MRCFQHKSGVLQATLLTINFLAIYRALQLYFYDFRTAIGPSMIPTIRQGKIYIAGDVLLVDKLTPSIWGYQINDIVLAKSPMKLGSLLCKRIMGVAGDIIVHEGTEYLIPEGHVWIEGDNKSQSFDSRNFGPIPLSLLDGRIIIKLWNWPEIFI